MNRIAQTNGNPTQQQMAEKPPAIWLTFDPNTQTLGVFFDPEQMKNWAFVKSQLMSAVDLADVQLKIQIGNAMQAQKAQQEQAEQLRRNLGL
jgi:hypothetical protein